MLKALYGDQRGSGGGRQKQISLPTREEASALCITPTTEEEKKNIDKILSSWGNAVMQKEEARIRVKQFGIVGLAHQAIWNPSTFASVSPLLHWIGIPEVLPRKASEFLHAASRLHDPELKEIAKDALAQFIYACRDEPEPPAMEGMDTVLSAAVQQRKSLAHAFQAQVTASLSQRRCSFHEQFMLLARGTRSSTERAYKASAAKNELARGMERVSNTFAARMESHVGVQGEKSSGGPRVGGPGGDDDHVGGPHIYAPPEPPPEPWDIKVRSLEAQKHALKLRIDEVCIALEGSVHIQKEMMREAGGLQRNQEMLKHQALAEELGTCQEAVGAYGEVNLISSFLTELNDLITQYEQEDSMTILDNDESYEQPLLDAIATWDQAVGDHVSLCASWNGRLQKEAADSRERSLLLDVSDKYDGSELALSAQALENALATLHHSQDQSVRSSWTTQTTSRSRVKNDAAMQEPSMSCAFNNEWEESSQISIMRHDSALDLTTEIRKGGYQSMGLEANNDFCYPGTFQGDDGQQKSGERISRRMSLMLPPVEHGDPSMEVHKRRSLPLPREFGLTDASSQMRVPQDIISPGGDSHLGDTTPIRGSRTHITGLEDF